jgi:hypothetical protein
MRERCFDPSVRQYPNYGGRGIVVCDRWRYSFENFKADMGQPPTREHSVDRIDNDGNYEPGNCRWATTLEQSRNKRTNVVITAFGETKIVTDWMKDPRCKIGRFAVDRRLKKGWTPEEALTCPSQRNW